MKLVSALIGRCLKIGKAWQKKSLRLGMLTMFKRALALHIRQKERRELTMLSRLSSLTIAMYMSVTGFVRDLGADLKNDERGLSGVVVAVLLILVAVLAVTMIWGLMSGWLNELWESITSKAGGLQ